MASGSSTQDAGGDEGAAVDRDVDAVSRQLLEASAEVRELEQRKRLSARSTGEFHALADEVADKAREVFHIAEREQELGEPDSPDPREREEQEPGDWTDRA